MARKGAGFIFEHFSINKSGTFLEAIRHQAATTNMVLTDGWTVD
jgi:hypothetical protein